MGAMESVEVDELARGVRSTAMGVNGQASPVERLGSVMESESGEKSP